MRRAHRSHRSLKKEEDPDIKNYDCYIRKNVLLPNLIKECPGQDTIYGGKCFKNSCVPVTDVLSKDNTVSSNGNVVLVKIDGYKYILKWNRNPVSKSEMLKEIRIQNIVYTLGLAPKIVDYYQDSGHVYIFMENLEDLGYYTINKLYRYKYKDSFKKIPNKVIKAIAEALKKLHEAGIAHKDAHSLNIFYNKDLNDVKIIDFGLSIIYKNTENASLNEDLDFTRWNKDTKNDRPVEWSILKNLVQ